ncbi:MAG: phosphotransferase [Pseudomonadales bacterium]
MRRKLLENLPADAPVGIFHGDFQTANLFCSKEGRLLAVIDWELCGLGATLNDLG